MWQNTDNRLSAFWHMIFFEIIRLRRLTNGFHFRPWNVGYAHPTYRLCKPRIWTSLARARAMRDQQPFQSSPCGHSPHSLNKFRSPSIVKISACSMVCIPIQYDKQGTASHLAYSIDLYNSPNIAPRCIRQYRKYQIRKCIIWQLSSHAMISR